MRTIRVKEIYDKKGQVLFSVITNAYALELLNVTNFWMEQTEIRTKRSFLDHFYLYYNFRSGLVVFPDEILDWDSLFEKR